MPIWITMAYVMTTSRLQPVTAMAISLWQDWPLGLIEFGPIYLPVGRTLLDAMDCW